MDLIKNRIESSINVKKKILQNDKLLLEILKISEKMIKTLKNGGKILFAGNGGSAADAQHLAAELSGRFYKDREPLYAEALHVNSSYITSVANDYSYDEIYSRLIKAQGKKGDIFVGISTSGNSKNILNAIDAAKRKGMITVAFTGESGGKMKSLIDYLINVPSHDTPRIQESHIMIGHIICELVEKAFI